MIRLVGLTGVLLLLTTVANLEVSVAATNEKQTLRRIARIKFQDNSNWNLDKPSTCIYDYPVDICFSHNKLRRLVDILRWRVKATVCGKERKSI